MLAQLAVQDEQIAGRIGEAVAQFGDLGVLAARLRFERVDVAQQPLDVLVLLADAGQQLLVLVQLGEDVRRVLAIAARRRTARRAGILRATLQEGVLLGQFGEARLQLGLVGVQFADDVFQLAVFGENEFSACKTKCDATCEQIVVSILQG